MLSENLLEFYLNKETIPIEMSYGWKEYAVELEPPKELLKPLVVPVKTLMAPGPSNCSERVLKALQHQLLGHLHPETLKLMDEIKAGLQYAFQTKNTLTLAISASGHAGMEASLGNILEPGETVLIIKSGEWGGRAANMSTRLGAHVEFLETELGVPATLTDLEAALQRHRPAVIFLAHAESSTGMKQPVEGIGPLAHRYGALLIVDTVASLGGEPFYTDSWGVDVVYTGSQKVLGAPPGITPISFSPAAEKKIFQRRTPIPVLYWDMTMLGRYWGCFDGPRVYHHTICATLVYGLREGLAQLAEETLPVSWMRHKAAALRLEEGLRRRGLELYISNPQHRLVTIVPIRIPENIEFQLVIEEAMRKHKVELAGGLGPTSGKIMRMGLMGVNATPHHVDLLLNALDDGLRYARLVKKSKI